MVKERNLFLCILFSVITCGIYWLYWFVKMTDETNELSDFKTAGGLLALVFLVISGGTYFFYWNYMLGKKVGDFEGDSSSGIFHFVLSLCCLGMMSMILAQGALNRKA